MNPADRARSAKRRSPPVLRWPVSLVAAGKALAALTTLSCLVLAGFVLVQWFTWPDAGWAHVGWFSFAVVMSAAPHLTLDRGNGWAMLCTTAMGSAGLWFAWQRRGHSGPLTCKATDTLCHIAEGIRLSAGEHAVMALFGLAGLGLVIGAVRYALVARRRRDAG
ncbi:hypothetical protein Q8X39_12605 [Leptothrix discophora]|uniref:Uncharacterized protein n=2 Tax=Leptothrix discophora TaxID=89 RepID=A0ABT9G4S9_LEPDI|nr:hypothetical protein [Leptothrix discophora]